MPSRRPRVCVVSVSGTATMRTRSTAGTDCTRTRNLALLPPVAPVVNSVPSAVCVDAPGSGEGSWGVGWVSVP